MLQLCEVSQPNTQWSIVYGLSTGEIVVTLGRACNRAYTSSIDIKE